MHTYFTRNGDIVLNGVGFFDLAQTLDCGQAFRWRPVGAGAFCGIAYGRRVEIACAGGEVVIKNMTRTEFEGVFSRYFGLCDDYAALREDLCRYGGEALQKALEFSPGLRLMRQDVWEVLVSFILSQNSNIPRIKKMIEALCECFGKRLACGGFAFPSPEALAAPDESGLAPVRCGYRAAYVIDAARRVADGRFDVRALENSPTADVYDALLQIHGVGPKVADCVLLYGFGRTERYPSDVWIKRAMAEHYPNGFPKEIKPRAGLAQQFLFRYMREG